MGTPTVGLVGDGPAVDAIRAALSDVDTDPVRCDPEDVGAADLGLVVGVAGEDAHERAARAARGATTPWLAVELGGVGGRPVRDLEAAVSGFGPETACFECLRTRVETNADDAGDAGPGLDQSAARFAGALAGRAAARLLSGGESPVLGGVVEVPHAERTLLPVPGCAACGADPPGGGGRLELTYEQTDLEGALARAERAVDDRVGVVASVGEVESFPVPYYLANVADTTGFSDARAAEQAAGVATDWNEALMKALGEALERYAAGVYRASAFRVAPLAALEGAVPPAAFVRPEDRADPAPDEEIAWVRARPLAPGDAADGSPDATALVPAEFATFPPPEPRYAPPITTGLGLGNSAVEAVLSGLYEVVERDATMLSWYSTFDPLGLDVADDRFGTLATRARGEGLSVAPVLVTQDVDVPVVAVAVHRETAWPKFAVGSDADLDAGAAAAGALAEALQNWMELSAMGPDEAADAEGAIGRYADRPDPARAFPAPETTVPADSVGPDDPPSGTAELDALLSRIGDAGLEAYAVGLTTRDVARLGFEAVRVVVPGAQPLFTGGPFFGERARTVPGDLGFAFRPDRDHHPYP